MGVVNYEKMINEQTVEITRHQPMMVMTDSRIECMQCHAMAVYLVLITNTDYMEDAGKNALSTYCQECWEKAVDDE